MGYLLVVQSNSDFVEQCAISNHYGISIGGGEDAPAYAVFKGFRSCNLKLSLFRVAIDRTAKRMLRVPLRRGGRFQECSLGYSWLGAHFIHDGKAKGKGSGLIEKDSIQLAKCFKIDSSLNDRTVP